MKPVERCEINTIYSFSEIIDTLSYVTERTLILFDIDDTLLSSPDIVARGSYFSWWFALLLLLRFPQFIIRKKWEAAFCIMWLQAPRFVIEQSIIATINTLKARGCTVLGFSSMETGSYGIIKNFPEMRYEMLAQRGITFSRKYPNYTFTQFLSFRDNYPQLFKGILCTNRESKGEVLAAFLAEFQVKPDAIIFFDDKLRYLKQVQSICREYNFACNLFYYRGVEKLPSSWNTWRALKQFVHLVNEKRWIGDQEIDME